MHRILIIGPCGAGKSTLAFRLADRLGLPLYHMDRLGWQPGWVETPKSEMLAELDTILATDSWIIDGNYGSSLPQRADAADTIIQLDYPIFLCFWRAVTRVWRQRGKVRADMADGCPERFDFAFLWYIVTWHFGPGPRTRRNIAGNEHKLIRFTRPARLEPWLAKLRSVD